MPAANPCLGCGFELDADGYLVRVGELSKTYPPYITPDVAGYKYCDTATGRSWDQPWNQPWGLVDEAARFINLVPSGTWTNLVSHGPHYMPYRRLRIAGYVHYESGAGLGGELRVIHNGYTTQPLQLASLLSHAGRGIAAVNIGVSGPNMGPWAAQWATGVYTSTFAVQVRAAGGAAPTFFHYSMTVLDDGPASAAFYTNPGTGTQTRFWPSPVPY